LKYKNLKCALQDLGALLLAYFFLFTPYIIFFENIIKLTKKSNSSVGMSCNIDMFFFFLR